MSAHQQDWLNCVQEDLQPYDLRYKMLNKQNDYKEFQALWIERRKIHLEKLSIEKDLTSNIENIDKKQIEIKN